MKFEKFGGLKSLMKIKGIEFEQINYRNKDVIQLLKDFYNLGNQKLDPQKRHRKPKKEENITKDDTKQELPKLQNSNKKEKLVKFLGKRTKFQ